ncbi:MAG TPA: hypothetical protein VNW28_09285, partial [Chthoniobacterales bacterium]|nr:hypothetical protein [Chthoniobacterales bacterium]
MKSRFLTLLGLLAGAFATSALAGSEEGSYNPPNPVVEEPYKFSAEFTVEQAYLGGADVQRGRRDVSDYDEYYSN